MRPAPSDPSLTVLVEPDRTVETQFDTSAVPRLSVRMVDVSLRGLITDAERLERLKAARTERMGS